MEPIYFDYNATTPLDPLVREAMLPFLGDVFGNPSSIHSFGRRARSALDDCRERTASVLRCKPSEIIFTSGGSEANNLAIFGVARSLRDKGRHIIVSSVERPRWIWLALRFPAVPRVRPGRWSHPAFSWPWASSLIWPILSSDSPWVGKPELIKSRGCVHSFRRWPSSAKRPIHDFLLFVNNLPIQIQIQTILGFFRLLSPPFTSVFTSGFLCKSLGQP